MLLDQKLNLKFAEVAPTGNAGADAVQIHSSRLGKGNYQLRFTGRRFPIPPVVVATLRDTTTANLLITVRNISDTSANIIIGTDGKTPSADNSFCVVAMSPNY